MVDTTQNLGRKRLAIEVEVNMHFEDFPGRETALSANLSLGGMFIASPEPKPVGTTVYLEFSVNRGLHTIKGVATVAWIRPKRDGIDLPTGMGVRFQALDEKGQEQILDLLQKNFPSEKAPFEIRPRRHADDGVPAIPQESFEREMDLRDEPFNPATDLEVPEISAIPSGVIPIVTPPAPLTELAPTPLDWTPPPLPQPSRLGGAAAARPDRDGSPVRTALGLLLLVVAGMAVGALLMDRIRTLEDAAGAGERDVRAQPLVSGALTAIESIEVDENDRTTLVILSGDGPLRDRVSHTRLEAKPPREVIRIAGIERPFESSVLTPTDSEAIQRIQVALHPRQGGSDLHIALELADPEIRVVRIQPRGNTLLVYLQ